MSVGKKATLFLMLIFAVSWTAVGLAWLQGFRTLGSAPAAFLVNVFAPAVAALVCSIAFEKGRRFEALGLRFSPNWWWLWALLIPFGIAALCLLISAPFSPYKFAIAEGVARTLAAARIEQHAIGAVHLPQAAGGIVLALLAFAVFFTLSEELGWRGYLYHLWRPLGFWRYSLAVGLIWAIWHWPINYLFGLNYADHPLLGLFPFTIACVLLSILFTLVRDRGGSVWAAGILHGAWNAVSLATPIAFVVPENRWTAYGLGGIVALAAAVLLVALGQGRSGIEVAARH